MNRLIENMICRLFADEKHPVLTVHYSLQRGKVVFAIFLLCLLVNNTVDSPDMADCNILYLQGGL